jgi:hypothetical protein
MCIMTGRCSEAAILMQTGKYKVQKFLAWQSVRMAQQVQGCQAPIQTAQTKMLGEPVLQLVFTLAMCQRKTPGCMRSRQFKL